MMNPVCKQDVSHGQGAGAMAKSIRSFFRSLFSDVGASKTNHKQSSDDGNYRLLSDSPPPIKGTSCVYRGQLKDGAQIAVKRLNCDVFKDIDGFCAEVQFLGRFCHKNLLSLKGYCAEGQQRMLVLDYMYGSSLFAHLHGELETEGHLDWVKRMAIAVGCAEGLAYLHHAADPELVHGNIKSKNVLLNSNFEPKIADFGLSRLLKDNVASPRGAFGYAAPEDEKGEESITKRSDVFSFGILLLELISGKNPTEKISTCSGKLSIVEWAQNLIIGGNLDDLVDSVLNSLYNHEELEILINTAILCAQEKPENRPSMLEVVEFLNGNFKQQIGANTKSVTDLA